MSSARVPCSSSQLLSAQQQTNNTLVPNTRTMNTANAPLLLISNEIVSSKRARTTSTSSIDTIRIGTGKKKNPSSKKRARASEPSTTTESNLNLLQNIRRSRPRKLSTETVVAVAFPSFSDDITESPRNDAISKKKDERKVTPPKLNPGHASPSVAVSTSSVAEALESSPSAIRQAPPPPIASAVRSRVLSMKTPSSRPTSPAHRSVTLPPHYRVSGFEPLPTHLQDWQPSSIPYCVSDDEGSLSDTDAQSAWKDVRPGISDMDLTISFSKKQPFFDVWDLPDDIYIAVPARLSLTLKNPQQWKDLTPSEPDLRYIDIRCNTFDYRPLSEYYPPEYSVSYTGASSTEYADPKIVPADLTRGIIVNKKWNKTSPGSRVHFKESLITNFGRLPDDSIETLGEDDEESMPKQGWFFKFMVPIPSWVLRQGNTRAFTVEASTWIGGLDQGGLIRGESELVISHLQSEREMVKGGGQYI